MNAHDREKYIVEYLTRYIYADVAKLSDLLHVSEMTIRRDLDKLEKDNQLLRVRGGARFMHEAPLESRVFDQSDAKYAIGRYAASLVEEGEAIALDASTTVYAMLPYLKVPMTVITSNMNIAMFLGKNDFIDVFVLGGKLRKSSMSLTGYDVSDMMQKYHVDKAFLSAKSINIQDGVMDATVDEGEAKKAILRSCNKAYFLFDHTKLDTRAFYHVCTIDCVTDIIVDQYKKFSKEQNAFLQDCETNGVHVHLATEGTK